MSPTPTDADAHFMGHALSLGQRGLGRVWPWPSVGCVIVKDGRVVGRGTSDPTTVRHAERVALDQAGPAAKGATVYVTLEPCAHHGRTPPCADALRDAGVHRVVVAIGDPNPLVAGQGLDRLRQAGVEVSMGVRAEEATEQHKGFLSVMTTGRPALTLKLATSLDGRIATASGDSRWITGPGARRVVHAMRLSHDAVLVGGGTARADDPTLTVRDMGAGHQPVRIVASRRLNVPWPNRLADSIAEGPVWLLCGEGDAAPDDIKAWTEIGASVIQTPVVDGQLSPKGLLEALGKAGITRVFCEGGSALAASLMSQGCVDDLIVMSAGFALGAEGQPAIGALGVSQLRDAERFKLRSVEAVDNDVCQHWTRPLDARV